MKGHKIELTEKQRAYLAKHFKNTKNKDLAEKLGIGLRSVVRIGREMGLTKTKQFMRKMQANSCAHMAESNRRMKVENPERYAELREIGLRNLKAGWQKGTRFKKGEGIYGRISKKKAAEMHAKAQETLRKLRNRDRVRIAMGLEPLTKLGIGCLSKEGLRRYKAKWALRKHWGYITEGPGRTVYYTDGLRRSPMEHLYEKRYGIRFEPWTGEERKAKEVKLPPDWKDLNGGLASQYYGG